MASQAAADWLARRDRGLTAAEQDEYLQWLREDPRRAAWIAQHETTLRRMQGLAAWQPGLGRETNPDLFAPRRRRRVWIWPAMATAAAIAALGIFVPRPAREEARLASSAPLPPAGNFLRVNERQALADGSVVELREGSHIEVRYSADERRVRLTGGEAHFTVAKDPRRPFIVEAGGVDVRAIGTVFNVRLDEAGVDVLVTEGQVRVEPPAPSGKVAVTPARAPVLVAASQRTVVPLAPAPAEPEVVSVTPVQVKAALAWQAPRLQFFETPLGEAVAEFNRHNRHRLVLGDDALSAIPIGGTFRVDNVEGFVRLLEVTLGIRGEARTPEETTLWPAH
jgi:transmembrane sensor